MMSRMCPKCGAELQDGELFCCECGAKYVEPAPQEQEAAAFCARCGAQLRPGTAFCPKCGAPQRDGGAAQTAGQRPARPEKPAKKAGAGRNAIIIAAIAAVTLIAVVIVLWLAGVFGGRESPAAVTPSGGVISGTDWDDVINIGGDDLQTDELSFPGTGYAAFIPEPGVGALSRVENRGGSNWAVYYAGVTVEQGKLYYAERGMAPEGAYVTLCEKITAAKQRIEENKAKIADITVDETIDDQTASGGRYAVRAFNSGGAMFEMVCQGGNMGIYIGEKYS